MALLASTKVRQCSHSSLATMATADKGGRLARGTIGETLKWSKSPQEQSVRKDRDVGVHDHDSFLSLF
jgi:hypothetical protein